MVVTAFLLPDTLRRLRLRLEEAVALCGAAVVTFKWDLEGKWQGPLPGLKDPENRFTVYLPIGPGN